MIRWSMSFCGFLREMGHVVDLMAIKMPAICVTSSVARGMRCVIPWRMERNSGWAFAWIVYKIFINVDVLALNVVR